MSPDTSEGTARPRSGPSTRDRILDEANEQFYAQGIRATSADRIIERVGITKVTFYRHFRTKSDLVVAYLERQAAGERRWMEGLVDHADPLGTLRALATDLGAASCGPGFRGCAFINAAAEFPDSDDPVRVVVDEHRRWTLGWFADIAAAADARDIDSTARQLMLLRDGAMVNGYLGDASAVADSLAGASASVIAAARG